MKRPKNQRVDDLKSKKPSAASTKKTRTRKNIESNDSDPLVIFDLFPEEVICLNKTLQIAWINQVACLSLNRPQSELLGCDYSQLWSEKIRSRLDQFIQLAVESGQNQCQELTLPNGQLWLFLIQVQPVTPGQWALAAVMARRIQENLLNDTFGRMTGQIAHEFCNSLTSIHGYSELIKSLLPPSHQAQDYIQKIVNTTGRAVHLIQQLLAFSRKAPLNPQVISLNEMIDKSKDFFMQILGEQHHLEIRKDPNLWPIHMDPLHWEQITLNLILNSRDAMNSMGSLTFETQNLPWTEQFQKNFPTLMPSDYVCFRCIDTGCGMSDEILPHVFDPLFSVNLSRIKPGLGLRMIYEMVQQNLGYIQLMSDTGYGTTVEIFFPKYTGVVDKKEVEPVTLKVKKRKERILLVEDAIELLDLGIKILSKQGYQVEIAKNGREALEKWEAQSGGFDLLVTDLIMPEMGGYELIQNLLLRSPKLKVMIMSGYSEELEDLPVIQERRIPFLQKPFTLSELTHKIREILDA